MVDKAKSSSDLLREGFDWPMTVGQVTKITGVTSRALRHYDEIGLLCPARTGEEKANNRKLYMPEDIDRLKQIVVLGSYGFELEEMRPILDGQQDVVEALEEQIALLRARENRLRNLVLFARYARIASDDLFEALAFGTSQVDAYVEALHETVAYQERGEAWEELDEAGRERMGLELNYLVLEFLNADDFIDVEWVVQELRDWFSRFFYEIGPLDLLNIWSLFEDESDEAEFVSSIGDESTPGFLQASVFLVWLQSMLAALREKVENCHESGGTFFADNENALVQLVDYVCRESGYPVPEAAELDKEKWDEMVGFFGCVMEYLARALSDEATAELMEWEEESGQDAAFFRQLGEAASSVKLFK